MIGRLAGIISEITKDYLIIDVGGVGYLVHCSNATFSRVNQGDKVSLIIETYVREDQISLYGFFTSLERDWFKKLTTVKGVGNKVALSILSVISAANLGNIIINSDKKLLSSVPGVGGRLSERIISELKGNDITLSSINITEAIPGINGINESVHNDAISALTNLGYPKNEAFNITAKILKEDEGINLNNLIKKALRGLSA